MKNPNLLYLLVVLFCFSCNKEEVSPILSIEEEVLYIVNDHRNSEGLPSLKMNEVMMNEARKHSYDMASGKISFGHDGFSDRIERIKNEIGGEGGAENLAMGYPDAKAVVKGWLSSDGHKRNIESNATITGIGVVKIDNGPFYYTQIFLKKKENN